MGAPFLTGHPLGAPRNRRRTLGRIAQVVEQLTLNQRVVGSSPTAPTNLPIVATSNDAIGGTPAIMLQIATALFGVIIGNSAPAQTPASQWRHQVLQSEAGSLGLKTPSGNIQCMIDDYGVADGSYPPFLRCDIRETTTPSPPKPGWCEFDWGNAFSITPDGRAGERMCVSDSVASDDWEVLSYGAAWQHEGFTCLSEQSGLTCFNAKHHGFTLSRSLQKLF